MELLVDLELTEIQSVGCVFSWSNKGFGTARVASRIERGIVNAQWMLTYSHVEANYLPPTVSDHSPLLIALRPKPVNGGRPFLFLNILADHSQFSETVQAAWQQQVFGSPMVCLWAKLKCVKSGLKFLHSQHFATIESNVEHPTKSLEDTQKQLCFDYTNVVLQQQEAECIANLKYWLKAQESAYKPKSRVQW